MSGAAEETKRLRAALQVAWTLVGPVANELDEDQGGRELTLACEVFRRTLGENAVLAEIEQLAARPGSPVMPQPGELTETLDRLTDEVNALREENALLRRGVVTGCESETGAAAALEPIPASHPTPRGVVDTLGPAAGDSEEGREAFLKGLGEAVPWLPAGGVVVAENAFRSAARNRLLARDPLMSEDEAVMVGFAQLAAIAGLWGRGEADGRLVAEVRGAQELARATRAYLVRVVRTVPGVRAELPFELALDREWNVNRNLLVLEGEHPYAPQLRVTSRRTEGALTVLEGASEGGFPRTVLLHSSLEV